MFSSVVIENIRPWGRGAVDVTIVDGRIAGIEPSGQTGVRAGAIDGAGRLALPSFTDAHVHLDSNRLGLPYRPHTSDGSLIGQIMNDRAHWRSAEASVAQRAGTALDRMVASGGTRARSYAQIDSDCGLDRFHGVQEAFAARSDLVDGTIIAFPQAGIIREPGVARLLEAAIDEGAGVIGGIDPCGLDRDPRGHLDVVFDIAARKGVPIDVHLHEPGELGLFTISLILERIRALGMQGLVTVSHAFALAEAGEARVRPLLEEFAELDVALTTIAPGGRPALPLAAIRRAGIRVGLGQDGQRDYWTPYGNGDMLDRVWQLAFTNGYRSDDLIELCAHVASVGGASVMGAGDATGDGLSAGDWADLVLVPGETVASAVMDRPLERVVIRRGRVVAEDGQVVGGAR